MTDTTRANRVRTIMAAAEMRATSPNGLVNLKARRLQCGLTQRELAARIGTKHGTYRNWEEGRFWPVSYWLPLLAEALHCSIEELFLPPEE